MARMRDGAGDSRRMNRDRPPRAMQRPRMQDGKIVVGRQFGKKGVGIAMVLGGEMSVTLPFPQAVERSIVESAKFTVKAKAGGFSTLNQVAVVREAQVPADSPQASTDGALAFIVDFQRMRTVSRIDFSGFEYRIFEMRAWFGAAFARVVDAIVPEHPPSTLGAGPDTATWAFTEVQTERLLVITDASPEDFTAHTRVMLPSPPSDLEILVNGTRAWTRPGPVKPGDDGWFTVSDVDLTAAIQAEIDAKRLPVTLTLNAGSPGNLEFVPTPGGVTVLKVYEVPLPDGGGRSFRFDSEGQQAFTIPLGSGHASWNIRRVRAVVEAELPPTRVQPADGPEVTDDDELIEIVLDPEHTFVVRLPAVQLDAFDELAGVRIPLFVEGGNAEISGVLRADADGVPGAPLDGSPLGPVTIEAFPRTDGPRWLTLALPRPRPLERGVPLWLALNVSRGKVSSPVVRPSTSPANLIWSGLPDGPFRKLSFAGKFGGVDLAPNGFEAGVRLAGVPSADEPIHALIAWFPANTDTEGAAALTPSAEGVPVTVEPGPRNPSQPFVLSLLATTPGTYRFRNVEIVYL